MNQHAKPVIRPAAPGNANHGVALPVPRATITAQTSSAALANNNTNAFQTSPTRLINPPNSVRRCHATMPTKPHTPTSSAAPLKSP